MSGTTGPTIRPEPFKFIADLREGKTLETNEKLIYASTWIRPFVAKLKRAYESSPVIFDEGRSIYVHAFHEPDPKGLLDLGIRVDHLMFGSDFPHPEGMADPLAYSEVITDLTSDDQTSIMGATIGQLMGVGA